LGAHISFPPVTLTGAGNPVRLNATYVTAEIHEVFGVPPALGPGFSPGDDEIGAAPVAVLGDALWRERFGGDRDIIGRVATLDGRQVTIVAVMPPGFAFPGETDLWLPLNVSVDPGHSFRYPVVARLMDGVTPEDARSLLADRVREVAGEDFEVALVPLKNAVVGDSPYPLFLLTGAVALVLLIACGNVANLLLMRAGTRDREMGVRKALGAGRGRLIRQLLTESVLLAVVGGAAGLAIAALTVKGLLALAPPGTIPRGDEVGVDLSVLAFVLLVSALTGIATGLAPALRVARKEVRDVIAHGGRSHSSSQSATRGILVVAEVTFAFVLLTGAGLLLRSTQELREIDLGFDTRNASTFEIDLPNETYDDSESMRSLHREVLGNLRSIPGVTAAGAANFEPLSAFDSRGTYTIEAPAEGLSGACGRCAGMSIASSGYFAAMGIPIVAGREFTRAEEDAGAPVVIVGRSMAERFWPGLDPVGRRLASGRQPGPEDWMTIVGVVEDVIRGDIRDPKEPVVYLLLTGMDDPFSLGHARYVLRTPVSRHSFLPAVRQAVANADPTLAIGTIATMEDVVTASIGDRLFETRILTAFAALALVLAGIGIYGVTAYAVNERRREIGIRRALGARTSAVGRLVFTRVGALVLPALLLGGALSIAVSRLIESLLYGVGPYDLATLVGVAVVLSAVAVAATLIPLREATRVSPVVALSE
jgi:predicted permease